VTSRKGRRVVQGVSCGVQGTQGYTENCWRTIGISNRLFCCTQTEKSGVSNSEQVKCFFVFCSHILERNACDLNMSYKGGRGRNCSL